MNLDYAINNPALDDNYFGPIYIPPPSGSLDKAPDTGGNGGAWYDPITGAIKGAGEWIVIVLVLLLLIAGVWKLG